MNKYNNQMQTMESVESFRITMLSIAFIVLLIALIGILYMIFFEGITNDNSPWFTYLVIPILGLSFSTLPWVSKGLNVILQIIFFVMLTIFSLISFHYFLELNIIQNLFSDYDFYNNLRNSYNVENQGIFVCTIIGMIALYITSYIFTKLSYTIKNFLYNSFLEYHFETCNQKYDKTVMEAFNLLNTKLYLPKYYDRYAAIDDIFTGTYKSRNFKIIECSIQHQEGSGKHSHTVIDFNGILLISNIITNTSDTTFINDHNLEQICSERGYNFEELRKLFPPKTSVEKFKELGVVLCGNIILHDNNQLYYWKTKSGNSFEISIFNSLANNQAKIEATNNEIHNLLEVIDIMDR